MNRDRWVSVVLVLLLVVVGLYAFWPKATPQPTPPATKVVTKKVAKAPAPPAAVAPPVQQAVPETIINIYPIYSPTPAPPASQPAPVSPVPPTSVYPQPMPPPTVVVERPVIVRQPSSLSFNFNIFASGVPYSGTSYGGWYGSGYWRPGYMAWVCEDRPSGRVCFEKWIP